MTDDARLAALERLVRLRDASALSIEEFEAEKQRLFLGSAAVAPVRFAIPAAYDEPTDRSAGNGLGRLIALALAVALLAALASWMFIGTKANCPGGKCVPVAAAKPAVAVAHAEPVAPTDLASRAIDLTGAIGFADAKECSFAPRTERLFDALLKIDDQGRPEPGSARVSIGALDLPVERTTRDEGDVGEQAYRYQGAVRFLRGTSWNGLQLSRAIARHHDGGQSADAEGSDERLLTFHQPQEAVRKAFERLGVSVPSAPAVREFDDGQCGGTMQLVTMDGGAALVCHSGGC